GVAVPDRGEDLQVLGVVALPVVVAVADLDLFAGADVQQRLDRLAQQGVAAGGGEGDVEVHGGGGVEARRPEGVGRRALQAGQRLVVPGECGGRGDRRLQDEPGLGQFEYGVAALAGQVRVDDQGPVEAGPDVGAGAVPELHDPGGLQPAQRLAHGRGGHLEALGQFARGGPQVPRLQALGADDLHDVVGEP